MSETNSFGAPAFDAEASPPSTAPLAYFSTTRRGSLNSLCVPTSLDQPVGAALGAQAGFARLKDTIGSGGFTQVRRATETPFNMILEARP